MHILNLLLAALTASTLSGLAFADTDTPDQAKTGSGSEIGASTLAVTDKSVARDVLTAIPQAGLLERFELQDGDGHLISYAGLTEGEPGGLVFVDQKLVGTVSRADTMAFYSCRGYVSAVHKYWGNDAPAWGASLVRAATPATDVHLTFSGKSTSQSIKSIVENPLVGQVKALVDIGTDPLKIVKTLQDARDNYKNHEHDQAVIKSLRTINVGDSEAKLAKVQKPEDVYFLEQGFVLAYPKYTVEFFVSDASIQMIQQPAFHQLAHDQASLFYAPGASWSKCTPVTWRAALPAQVK